MVNSDELNEYYRTSGESSKDLTNHLSEIVDLSIELNEKKLKFLIMINLLCLIVLKNWKIFCLYHMNIILLNLEVCSHTENVSPIIISLILH